MTTQKKAATPAADTAVKDVAETNSDSAKADVAAALHKQGLKFRTRVLDAKGAAKVVDRDYEPADILSVREAADAVFAVSADGQKHRLER